MFKTVSLIAFFIITTCFSQQALAQFVSNTPPYLVTKSIPDFKISTSPDSVIFTNKDLKKNRNTVFIMFSPDCEFCQHETRDLIKNISRFKNTQFVMISFKHQQLINEFYKKYGLAKYHNITVGKDSKYFFFSFFKLKIAPSTFVYDRNGNFKKDFNQIVDMETLLKEINN